MRSEKATVFWGQIYSSLSAEKPGLFGAITGRAEAQVVRLSALFAVLDQSPLIKVNHLKAALAVWQYSEDSARYLFGGATGNALADKIDHALRTRPAGLTRTEIRDLLGRNVNREAINRALALLREYGMAVYSSKETGGRPAEHWVSSYSSYMSLLEDCTSKELKQLPAGPDRPDGNRSGTMMTSPKRKVAVRHRRQNGSIGDEDGVFTLSGDMTALMGR